MDAKLDKISELSNILCEKESLGQKIVAVSHDFDLGKLMRQAHITKDQGVPFQRCFFTFCSSVCLRSAYSAFTKPSGLGC